MFYSGLNRLSEGHNTYIMSSKYNFLLKNFFSIFSSLTKPWLYMYLYLRKANTHKTCLDFPLKVGIYLNFTLWFAL